MGVRRAQIYNLKLDLFTRSHLWTKHAKIWEKTQRIWSFLQLYIPYELQICIFFVEGIFEYFACQ